MTKTQIEKTKAMVGLCSMDRVEDRVWMRQLLQRLLDSYALPPDPERATREILLELGAPDHLIGHSYVVYAVVLAVQDEKYIRNLTMALYPQVAAKFDTTAARVERSIRNLVEVIWLRGNLEVLQRYFGATVHPERGRPTNGEFIARLASVVRQNLKDGL